MTTIFTKILSGEIPCSKVYEDEWVLAFDDISPVAPVHVLIIPKKYLVNLNDVLEQDNAYLAAMMRAAKQVAIIKNLQESGYRTVINNGANAGQSVFHMHMHVIGGRALHWPPG